MSAKEKLAEAPLGAEVVNEAREEPRLAAQDEKPPGSESRAAAEGRSLQRRSLQRKGR
jgi:hypothetical protein